MNKTDMLTIQRQLGIIEGVTLMLPDDRVDYILDALERIDKVLGKEDEDESEG